MGRHDGIGGAHLVLDGHGHATLVFGGDVDLAAEHQVRRLLDDVADRRPPSLLLDLCAIRFADAAVVRLSLRARDAVAGYGGVLRIHAPPAVRRLFDLTGTGHVLPVRPCPARR